MELVMNATSAISGFLGDAVKPLDPAEPTQPVQAFQWSLNEVKTLWAAEQASSDAGDGLPAVVGAVRDGILPFFERRRNDADLSGEVNTGRAEGDANAFFEKIKEQAGEERQHHLSMQLIIAAFTGLISTLKMLLRG
ncbi:hypothetical protein IMF23_13110 [Chelatococcus daeguensis]|uniref:Uncharacterized protein n=1 Tax=Chelatococcus daeguensis TaxID=444444 RepID=A0AAC9JUL5_9HYPH|nr:MULTISPECIES: hypothetical protein [Chelatococcus]APF38715.1 hypothetical protein BOQ54_16450 [Chelatococcus daeguensis]KZE28259.1 hypothetical protein AVW15_09170 [Chelatococcus daeguensis]MBM3084379.1 hypothetical protein [Chelatococcus daeguensis]